MNYREADGGVISEAWKASHVLGPTRDLAETGNRRGDLRKRSLPVGDLESARGA